MVTIIFFSWDAGYLVAHHLYFSAAYDGIIVLFWVVALVFLWLGREIEGELKALKEVDKIFQKHLGEEQTNGTPSTKPRG